MCLDSCCLAQGGSNAEALLSLVQMEGLDLRLIPSPSRQRTCTTIIKTTTVSGHRVTELVEPSSPVDDACVVAISEMVRTLLTSTIVLVIAGSITQGFPVGPGAHGSGCRGTCVSGYAGYGAQRGASRPTSGGQNQPRRIRSDISHRAVKTASIWARWLNRSLLWTSWPPWRQQHSACAGWQVADRPRYSTCSGKRHQSTPSVAETRSCPECWRSFCGQAAFMPERKQRLTRRKAPLTSRRPAPNPMPAPYALAFLKMRWSSTAHTGKAVLSTTRRRTKLECTPVTPWMRVMRLSNNS